MTIADIYKEAKAFINTFIRKEMVDQGHHLTGAMEESLEATITAKPGETDMEGFAAHYTQYVNYGFPASSANFGQVPYLIDYFKKRGLSEKEATGAAFATVKVWMKEGMPTTASNRFSTTGKRTNMIEDAFEKNGQALDNFIGAGFDRLIEAEFQQEKSETI